MLPKTIKTLKVKEITIQKKNLSIENIERTFFIPCFGFILK
jgi:hypothetical protein